ncbi:MAG: diguanylate cyclase [Clostridia bacterium]|nr:diguanylate cyclase [Clostridia bacterium]
MAGKIRIRSVSNWNIVTTVILAVLCVSISVFGFTQYSVLRSAMQDYISCENAAHELQNGSDILTKQVRLAAGTGDSKYIDAYFQEANITKSREKALEDLSALENSSEAVEELKKAMEASVDLMQTEFYSMRLVEESIESDPSAWPQELQTVELSENDASLSSSDKLNKAQQMVISLEYEEAKDLISGDVNAAIDSLTQIINNRQNHAANVFTKVFVLIIICVLVFSAMMLLVCLLMRYWIVRPLMTYNTAIQRDVPLVVRGANELQVLAQTYNRLYEENEERQKLIQHQAEHDPLTDLLNRGSFDRILNLYEQEQNSFALILVDVDTFKSVNDTYGHAVGDVILKKVARLLTTAFRNIDYICRIGGDEFAVIMVDMTTDLSYTITDKIQEINRQLSVPESGIPAVSLSVGVAFTDREKPGKSLFTDADKALYYTKYHGKDGCSFYPVD